VKDNKAQATCGSLSNIIKISIEKGSRNVAFFYLKV